WHPCRGQQHLEPGSPIDLKVLNSKGMRALKGNGLVKRGGRLMSPLVDDGGLVHKHTDTVIGRDAKGVVAGRERQRRFSESDVVIGWCSRRRRYGGVIDLAGALPQGRG